jgi:two-component system cell cycle sensor histidine kinase/response regulator CckA
MAQKITDENRKQALIGRIAGKMAHDFNNILGIIMGNAELALIDCPDHQTKKKLDLIYNQTIRGKNLTKNLVAFAKDQEPKQEFFSIGEKIDLVLNLLKKDLDGINVIRQYSHGIPELLADPGMIEHAIVNLVQNSIHAVSLVERPQIIVRIYHQGEFIFFEIEDNGCGIPSEFLGGIYEPSFTLKGSKDKNGMYKPGIKGTGYGMSNVKRYIEQHKGNISIHSELQKGTNVTIKLPVIKKELTDEEIKDVKKEKIYFEKHILLVEDEQAISDIQYSILTHDPCNHRVDVANTGQMAIDLLKRNQYDLISLDYVLPGNFNGMDVYHHIRERNNAVPVLFISGNIEFLESIKDLKQKDPYVDHLSKPCKNIDYVNGVNKLFRSVAI